MKKRKYTVYQVNAFTDKKFTGNPAGVVPDAEGLSEDEMLLIARELKNSETAFLFSPTEKNAIYDTEIRFFTPTTEVPICGHATIAAHYVKAIEHRVTLGRIGYQKTKAGVLPIEILKAENDFVVKMTQGKVSFSSISIRYQEQIIEALGLNKMEINPNSPIEIASTGHSKVMIGIKERSRLNLLNPDFLRLKEISALISCNGFFVFVIESDGNSVMTHGRMFAPAIGIDEDPVTGNANGPLGAYLIKNGLVEHDGSQFRFVAKQGEALGRAGTIEVMVSIRNGVPVMVEIVGKAVIVFKAVIEL